MISSFYRRQSRLLLIICGLALPLLTWYGEHIPTNNDIDTWLPRNNETQRQYQEFLRTFGTDEVVLVAFEQPFPDPARLESAAGRLAGVPGVTACWTRQQVVERMVANGVDSAEANERLIHLLQAPHGELETILLTLANGKTASRCAMVRQIRSQLHYCGLDHALLAGGAVVTAQLDELGGRERARTLFQLTLLICAVLLYLNIRCWKASAMLVLMNIFSIECTLSLMRLFGQSMNFILGSLPVLVMVFTTSAAVHLIGQYIVNSREQDRLGAAIRAVFRPSLFAALTTVIGLLSLDLSDIGPITDFGNAAAAGTLISFVVGLGLTPAVLEVVKYNTPASATGQGFLERMGMRVINHPVAALIPMVLITVISTIGLLDLKTLIDPLDFLPGNDRVLRDTRQVQAQLTSPTSIEAILDFAGTNSSFISRLAEVRRFETAVTQNANVCHALSLADFFPADAGHKLSVSSLMSASGSGATGSLLADGCRLWRVSVRLVDDTPAKLRQTLNELQQIPHSQKVTFTGLGPLLEHAQGSILQGFWTSFSSALVIMTVVMMIALRSPVAGIVAMIPNVQPIAVIFGLLGWLKYPVDIGIMMTASIALGLTVDGTFHFLCLYQSSLRRTACRYRAVRHALVNTGLPMMSSGLISGIGLLALALSPFRPTMHFGVLMFLLMTAATVSGLVLFPACLALRTRRRRTTSRTGDNGIAELFKAA